MINELNEKEDSIYRALKQIYKDTLPIVRIARPTSNKAKLTEGKDNS